MCNVGDKMTDEEYMNIALGEAKKAYELGEIPIGAVLVVDNEIIAKGHNLRELEHDATAHAEMVVIKKACDKLKKWRLTGATLYVTIEPCPMCAGAIVMSRLERLVYGSPDYKAGGVESIFNIVQNQALNHQVTVTAGVKAEECSNMMKSFFKERRKKKKADLTALN